jgi:sporulation protein YlmC with PRC-barrel domain
MRKTMMATASAFALVLGAAALAPAAAQTSSSDTLQPQTGTTGTTGTTGAQTGTTGTTGTTGMAGTTGMPDMGGDSYADLDDDEREGISFSSAQDDWEADDVIGASVVDSDGEEIGEIEDLIVTDDETIERAVIKVSGDDDEERFHVVRLDELERAEGDDSDELTLNRTAVDGDYFVGESSFEKEDGKWEES